MAYPHTLIFVDLVSDDPAAAGKFYSEVFGWRDDERPLRGYHRLVPGGDLLQGGARGPAGRGAGSGSATRSRSTRSSTAPSSAAPSCSGATTTGRPSTAS